MMQAEHQQVIEDLWPRDREKRTLCSKQEAETWTDIDMLIPMLDLLVGYIL